MGFNLLMAGSERSSRVPSAVGSIPLVGGLVRQADNQARWLQDVLEQNARLVGQLPATLKAFNDSLERFNDTVARLDRMIDRIDGVTTGLIAPIEQVAARLERVRDIPELVDTLRHEALPALRAATDTQQQVAALAAMLERVVELFGDLPGAGLMRRFTAPGESRRPRPPDSE
jgi:ABC-type transporter Mla subunit MlaD